MKVLFTLLYAGGLAHLNPLIALDAQCRERGIETAFLVPKFRHKFLRSYGLNVLDIDHQSAENMGFRTEMQAYGKFSPDVVIDDASLTTYFAAKFYQLPRISIQRTGIFPNSTHRQPDHNHSMGNFDMKKIPDVSYLGIKQPESFEDFFSAEAKIVPGIESIEILPSDITDPDSYFFSGPLIIEDFMAETGKSDISFTSVSKEEPALEKFKDFSNLNAFFDEHKNRKFIYITYGTIAVGDVPEELTEAIKWLLDEDFAIVSSIPIDDLSPFQKERFCFSRYFPMHNICEKVDLMIHHCGSGTYQYPIIHQVPTITIGTQCYDREEVAYRLEELGASTHLPSPLEQSGFSKKFKKTVELYLKDSEFISKQKEILGELSKKTEQAKKQFDITKVIEFALNKK